MSTEQDYARAANWIRSCDGLMIGAGAGMGVDSGLPDFRGNQGFWNAYPAFRSRGLSFVDMANPLWFETDPAQAWGFYGHRLSLYRRTIPHQGFDLLDAWAHTKSAGAFVYTSNVDGQFQVAGFDPGRIVECHGSIHFLQCSTPCSRDIWPNEVDLEVDEDECLAIGDLPRCPKCRRVARPNILMFQDAAWIPDRTEWQHRQYTAWLTSLQSKRLVVIECGAGTAIPSVRHACQQNANQLIRINPREAEVTSGGLALRDTALSALLKIERQLSRLR